MDDKFKYFFPMIHKDKLVYRYKRSIRIGTDDNDVLEINDNNNDLYDLLLDMNGQNSIAKLQLSYQNQFKLDDLISIIKSLEEKKVLSVLNKKFNDIDDNDRYSSDLVYYYSEGFDGEKVLSKLKDERVTVFGAGGAGSHIASQLVSLGIKNIKIVDNDKIEIKNLNRQSLYKLDDVGMYKVDALKNYILERNENVHIETVKKRIETIDDALLELDNATFCICAIDEPAYIAQRIVNKAAYHKNIPSLYGFSSRDSAKMIYVSPNKSGCIDCLLLNILTDEFLDLVASLKKANFKPVTPIISPTMLLETSWMVKKWLSHYLGKDNITNCLYRFDYSKFIESKFIKFTKNSHCPTCSCYKEPLSYDEKKLWNILEIK